MLLKFHFNFFQMDWFVFCEPLLWQFKNHAKNNYEHILFKLNFFLKDLSVHLATALKGYSLMIYIKMLVQEVRIVLLVLVVVVKGKLW